jgi:uncharacterized protein (DUF885 family)
MRASVLLASLLLAATSVPVMAQDAAPVPAAAAKPAPGPMDARLRALYDAEWEWRQKEQAQIKENGRWVDGDRLTSETPADQARRLAYWQDVLKQLDAIPMDQLSPEEQVNAAVFRQSVWENAKGLEYKTYEAPFNADTFFWSGLNPRSGGFATAQALSQLYRPDARHPALLRRADREYARRARARVQRAADRGAGPRQVTIKPYLPADQTNSFYDAFKEMPSTIPAADQAALRAEGEKVIRETVAPAYAKLYAFIRDDYMKKARTTLAGEKQPDGPAFYQAQIKVSRRST